MSPSAPDTLNRRDAAALTAATLCVRPLQSLAQSSLQGSAFPSRAVRYVVPYAAGGPTDAVARLVAAELSTLWPHPVFVDNRPGANANIGADFVAKSPPDGHTLLQGTSSTHGSNPAVFSRLPYDAYRDFVAVVPLIEGPVYLAVKTESSLLSLGDLVQAAQRRPGELHYGTSGPGSPQHLAAELFALRLGLRFVPIHFHGASGALLALQRGEIAFYFDSTALVHERAGRVRVLGVSTSQRWPLAPRVPTLMEAGVPDFDLRGWFGIFAPAATDPIVVRGINEDVNRVLALPKIREKVEAMGYRVTGGPSADFAARVEAERQRWADVVRKNRLQID